MYFAKKYNISLFLRTCPGLYVRNLEFFNNHPQCVDPGWKSVRIAVMIPVYLMMKHTLQTTSNIKPLSTRRDEACKRLINSLQDQDSQYKYNPLTAIVQATLPITILYQVRTKFRVNSSPWSKPNCSNATLNLYINVILTNKYYVLWLARSYTLLLLFRFPLRLSKFINCWVFPRHKIQKRFLNRQSFNHKSPSNYPSALYIIGN